MKEWLYRQAQEIKKKKGKMKKIIWLGDLGKDISSSSLGQFYQ